MYSNEVEQYITKEFPTLQNNCYLDHTGATLYAKSQISAVMQDLCDNIYGNPHSLSVSSRYCSDVIDQVRYRILQHFNTNPEEYSIIFTSSATNALKVVAECFDWKGVSHHTNKAEFTETTVQPATDVQEDWERDVSQFTEQNEDQNVSGGLKVHKGTCENPKLCGNYKCHRYYGTFLYLQDNHTSVLGMRELAADRGAHVQYMSHNHAFEIFGSKDELITKDSGLTQKGNSLFVYPAQCNFSGVKYPLWWVDKSQHGVLDQVTNLNQFSKWFCLLDAAAYVPTSHLDLSAVRPDFVCVSFYKMFGYPTGLGALIVKNSSAYVLDKRYFGGGTVLISLSSERFHVPRPVLSDKFEDGTLPFLSIISLRHCFDTMQRLTTSMTNIMLHTLYLARYVHHSLLLLHHANGSPVAVLYSDTDYEDFHTQGNIVNFNLLRPNKEFIGYVEVLNMANLYGIHLRTGCFCNPGACQRHLGLSVEDLRNQFQAGHVCGDENDLIDGRPTGSVRISFGYMSTQKDADKFLDMITTCFVKGPAVTKVPQWWPGFQKTYRDKFAMKNSKYGFQNNLDVSQKEKTLSLDNNSSDGYDKEKEEMLQNCSVNLNVEPTSSVSGISEAIFDQVTSQLRIQDDVNSCYIQQNYSSDETINSKCDLEVTEHSELLAITLCRIFVYPVKSCGAMSVRKWKIGSRGLIYDREWMIVTPSGVSLTQKHETKLCLIRPTINLDSRELILNYPGLPSISVCLDESEYNDSSGRQVSLCQSKVCGDRVHGWDCGEAVAEWLNTALSREGLRLIRQWNSDQRIGKPKKKKMSGETDDEKQPSLSLSNQAQYLLVNQASIQWLGERVEEETDCTKDGLLERFRSNLAVQGLQPFDENDWSKLQIGNVKFAVDGPCTRCQMICIDQGTGERTREPLRTLSAAFHGKMRFGIYLRHLCDDVEISVEDRVVPFW